MNEDNQSFWGGASSKAPIPSARHIINWKLILGLITLIALLIVAVIINVASNNESATQVTGAIDIDNGDEKINWDRYPTTDVELSETYEITKSGTYNLTGAIPDGLVSINVPNGVVRLILNNVTIENSSGPAISCIAGDDLVIELIGDNKLSDSDSYSANYDEDITGVLYSKADLTLNGEGKLTITARYQDGIVSKDDLKIVSGTYTINSIDDGVRGKDSVYIVGGDFTIESGADAIKSTNETEMGKGFVLIEDGTFNLVPLAKGIKAVNSVMIYGGDYVINSYDDAIHSDNYVGITGGNFEIKSGDDGIHANKKLIIDDGLINIAKAYEGLEAQAITINGGYISVTSSDDGINAGGGADSSATNRKGAGAFNVEEDCIITINNGKVYINASGDGIDSNGYAYINGGELIVDGPTNNGNGALDAGANISMTGGSVIAIGASGMAVALDNTSSVYNLSAYLASTQAAGTKIEIRNSNSETIISHTSAKTFSHMTIGSEQFFPGETYTIYLNDQKYQDFTISEVTTVLGNSNNNFNNNFRR